MENETSEELKLLHGPSIQAYPKEEPAPPVDNKLDIDTTGTYLVEEGQKPTKMPEPTEEEKQQIDFFYQNAFAFIDRHERIFKDSRMFLTPIPVVNELAYTGTSGLRCPTLGVYLEWWMMVKAAVAFKDGVLNEVICHFAGSPLSGSNKCLFVDVNRQTSTRSVEHFIDVWQSFMDINKYYDEAKAKYQAYSSLEEVAQLLAKNETQSPQ